MTPQTPLASAAAELAAALRAGMPEHVTVPDPAAWGYPHRHAPYAAVDPPKITRTETGLARTTYYLTADAVLVASATPDTAGLLTLTDQAITAVRAAGLTISQVNPAAVATAAGVQPAYAITVELVYTESR